VTSNNNTRGAFRGKGKRRVARRHAPRNSQLMTDNPIVVPRHTQYHTLSHPLPALSKVFTTRVMTTTGSLVTASNSAAVANSYYFSLADLDETSAYTTLFDQYRIDAVVFRILPMQNAIGLTTNSTTTTVRFYSVVDYDDANVLTSEGQARAFESCVITPPGMESSRTFQPRQAIAAYQGAFTGYANVGGLWNDCNSTGIQFFGVKTYIPQATAAQTQLQSWTIERDYYVSFRKVHG
jgi:hypothetical protein